MRLRKHVHRHGHAVWLQRLQLSLYSAVLLPRYWLALQRLLAVVIRRLYAATHPTAHTLTNQGTDDTCTVSRTVSTDRVADEQRECTERCIACVVTAVLNTDCFCVIKSASTTVYSFFLSELQLRVFLA